MGPRKLPTEIESELRQAQAALAEGNDGKARVCARRAVGKAFSLSKYSGSDVCRSALSATESLKVIIELAEKSAMQLGDFRQAFLKKTSCLFPKGRLTMRS